MYEDIAAAAAAHDRAGKRLRRLVATAVEQDDRNVAAIAAAAGITRQTAYRWAEVTTHRATSSDQSPAVDRAAAMDDALLVLLELGAGPTHTLTAGLRPHVDPLAKARRVRLGASNLPGSAAAIGASDEQQAILSAGLLAATATLDGAQ